MEAETSSVAQSAFLEHNEKGERNNVVQWTREKKQKSLQENPERLLEIQMARDPQRDGGG